MTKECPFCAEDILDAAIKCKHCGSNLTSQPAPVITSQRTNKKIKASQAFGWLMLLFPLWMCFAGDRQLGAILLVPSVIWIFVTRVARWWTNE